MSDKFENDSSGIGMQTEEFLPNGTIIDQRYEVINALSYGDGRAVYLCRLLAAGQKEVAMKVLHRPRPGEDFATTAKRFRTELVAAYNITHANVVHVFEFIENENFLAYTMEYVSGGNLDALIEERGTFDPESARRYLSQICAGLHAIHEQGIIHREVKPRNILITKDGDLKITDFGVARVKKHKNLTVQGGLVGTMDYLSPEYITEGKLDKSLDIYSAGVIGYQLLTGVVPFEGSDMMTMLTKRLTETPEHPSDIDSKCSRELGDIVMKALEIDPADRFQNSLEMHLALDALGTLDVTTPFGVMEESPAVASSFDSQGVPQVDSASDSSDKWRKPTQLDPIDSSFSEVEDSSYAPPVEQGGMQNSEMEQNTSSVEFSSEPEVAPGPGASWTPPVWDGDVEEDIPPSKVSYFEEQNISATLTGGGDEFDVDAAMVQEEEMEVLTAIHSDTTSSIDTELRSELMDSFEDEDDEDSIFGQPTSAMSPTVSDLHRAIEARSAVRIGNPKLLFASAFCVALGLGMFVNAGPGGKTDNAQAVSTGATISENSGSSSAANDPLTKEARDAQASQGAKNQAAILSPEEEEGAISEYKLLLSLNPGDPKVNYNLGLLYVGRGEYKTAEKYLAEAVRLDPANSTAEYYLKKVRRKLAKSS